MDYPVCGGISDPVEGAENRIDVINTAKFAVDEHNKKQNTFLEFSRVEKVQYQVVAGRMHHLTLEVLEAGKKELYKAKVWEKPWMDFKQLSDFTRATPSGVTRGE